MVAIADNGTTLRMSVMRGRQQFERVVLMAQWTEAELVVRYCLLQVLLYVCVWCMPCKFLHSAFIGSCWILIYANEIYATNTNSKQQPREQNEFSS